jgi:hypothetical protein
MNNSVLARLAAASGIVFPVGLFLAAGNGDSLAPWRAVVASWALVLFLPFLAYLCGLLGRSESEHGWLASVALVSGVSGVLLKLLSGAPDLAIHRDRVAEGTPLYDALHHLAGAATVLALYPLAICLAAVGALVVRNQVLPRWLGAFAAVAAVALAVNGAFVTADFVPGLLVFMLWTLVAALSLARRVWSASAPVAYVGQPS